VRELPAVKHATLPPVNTGPHQPRRTCARRRRAALVLLLPLLPTRLPALALALALSFV